VNTIPIWGGGERWTLETAAALRARGHALELVAAAGGALEAKARAAGIPVHAWRRDRSEQRRVVRALRESHREHPPRAVIGATGRDTRLAERLRPRGADTVLAFARQLDKRLTSPIARRITFRHLDLVVANSEATRRTMAASLPWFPTDRLVSVYNPFDAEAFSRFAPRDVRAELGIDPRAYVVAAVGRLSRQKGLDVLLTAFPGVRARVPDAVLLLVGGGEQEAELRERVSAAGLDPAVRFTGHVDAVQPYYAAADVVAVPSFFEGFCYTAVEAQALGRPVVATSVSSLPEVVAANESGYLVPPGDPDALGGRLVELAGDAARRRGFGEAGRRHVRRFAPDAVYAALERVLESATRR